MQELHFTTRDIRFCWAERKRLFWQSLEGRCKDTARRMLEEGLSWEIREQLQVDRYQRLPQRTDWRNGYTARSLKTRWGHLKGLKVPRSRKGTYQSGLLERYSRWAGGFEKQVEEAVLLGMSTRKTATYFSSFFGSALFSAQAISALLRKLDQKVAQFHKRPLADDFEYLFLDGFALRIRQALRRPYTALIAWGMKTDGSKELIDYKIVTSEKAIFCQSFLESLFQRGLTGKNLRLIITDGAKGFTEAASWVYGQVPQQSCIVHRLRNINRYLKHSSNRKSILKEAKAVFKAGDKKEAVTRARAFIWRWQDKEPKAVSCFTRDLDSSLVFYDQPKELWNKLKSTNPLERLLREFRRRIRLIDSFANLSSADRWMYALTQKIH